MSNASHKIRVTKSNTKIIKVSGAEATGNNIVTAKTETRVINNSIAGPAGTPGPAPESIDDLGDVSIDTPDSDDVIMYNSTTQKWTNRAKEDVVDGGNF